MHQKSYKKHQVPNPAARARKMRFTKLVALAATAAATAYVMTAPAFAAPDTAGLQATIDNIVLIGTIVGSGLGILGIILCGIKFTTGGRDALQQAKGRIACVVGGFICIAGAQGIGNFLRSLNGFS